MTTSRAGHAAAESLVDTMESTTLVHLLDGWNTGQMFRQFWCCDE